MNIIRNILAVVIGAFLGGVVNMTIVMVGPMVVPPPAGVDMTTVEGLKASIHLLGPQHFISPFLAHAVGTFVGALAAWLIAASYKSLFAYVVGGLFLIGGISACFLIPAPPWFMALDLVVAYIPMALLAIMIGRTFTRGGTPAPVY
jgi:hypothetical protein